mmetsp:Transcript_31426/g.73148  ORF Transcript_31426/g.73148 Transcript_31426/m.73148 type:complete len:264 (-) Transcript_31426:366-1157(-)
MPISRPYLGIMRLGYAISDELSFWCDGVLEPGRMGSSLASEKVITMRCANHSKDAARSGLAAFSDGDGGSFGIRIQFNLNISNSANAVIALVNVGVHYNSPEEYQQRLQTTVKKWLSHLLSLTPHPPALLWRETLPQHFATRTGTYPIGHVPRSTTDAFCNGNGCGRENLVCESLEGKPPQFWNGHFAAWLANESALARHVTTVAAFDAFAGRHDLHRGHDDCTHFFYTPFTWMYVWDDIARKLASIRRVRDRDQSKSPRKSE